MEELPPEMTEEIISRLPVMSLCRFKCVSKAWRSMISDPDFVANYPRRRRVLFTFYGSGGFALYSLDPDQFLTDENGDCHVEKLDYVSGVHGWVPFVFHSSYALFLSYVFSKHTVGTYAFSLINPVTKESKKLPKPPIWRLPLKPFLWFLYGVGFDHSTNEYKVINLQDYRGHGSVFSVYTLQTDSWRQIDHLFPYEPSPLDAILVNGGLHWWARKIADNSLVILCFLFEQEKVREIPPPPSTVTTTFDIYSGLLGAFRNCLCITSLKHPLGQERCTEFLVMKEYGARESWTVMRVSIPYWKLSHSGFWTETHDLMVFDKKSLVMYNFNDGTFWCPSIPVTADEGRFGSIGTYLETLPEQHERLKEDESTG